MRLLFLILFCFNNSISFSQNSYGYFGKKNFIDLSFNIHTNYFLKKRSYYYIENQNDKIFFNKNNQLVSKDLSKFEYEFLSNIGRQIHERFSISVFLKFGNYNIYQKSGITNYINTQMNNSQMEDSRVLKIESLPFYSFSILPTLTFNQKGISSPNGFVFSIGFGPTYFKLLNPKSLLLNYEEYFDSNLNEYKDKGYLNLVSNIEEYKKRGFTLLLNMGYRKSLSKSLSLNYGFSSHLNFIKYYNYQNNYVYTNELSINNKNLTRSIYNDITSDVKKRFFSFNLGFSYLF